MGDREQNKEGYETSEPTSHETQVDKRIHPLSKSQPVGPVGTLGSTASSKMQNTTAEEDPEVLDRINKHYSPARHLQSEANIRAFIRAVLNEASSGDKEAEDLLHDKDELDEFAAVGGGAIAGMTGPLSGQKRRPGAGAVKT